MRLLGFGRADVSGFVMPFKNNVAQETVTMISSYVFGQLNTCKQKIKQYNRCQNKYVKLVAAYIFGVAL